MFSGIAAKQMKSATLPLYEAVLRTMKCAFGTLRNDKCASLHVRRKPCASYWRRPMLHFSLKRLCNYAILCLEEGVFMRNDKLSVPSMDFAVSIINLVKFLKENKEHIISNQIGRSGTSIGANIREAQYAHGKADFISKLQIALKEANETGYWLELLYKTNYINEKQHKELDILCAGLRAMLIASINTAKENANK